MNADEWTVDDHVEGRPEHAVALYRQFEEFVLRLGEVTVSVSKSTITFKGPRRGFAGGKPTKVGLRGYFDLTRNLGTSDHRILNVAPYQRQLHVHHFTLTTPQDLDDEFCGWIREAYDVGCGKHLTG